MFLHFLRKHRGGWCQATAERGDGSRGPGPGTAGSRRGGPFGRHRGGPFGGRGPRMFDSGALRLVVLGLIAEAPRHGYDIIKAFEARFQGTYSPSPGALYPMLQMLEEADLVVSTANGNKRLYTITEAGTAYLVENKAELDRINAQLDQASGDIRQSAIGEELHRFRRVLHEKLRQGALTAEQAERIRAIVTKARTDIEEV